MELRDAVRRRRMVRRFDPGVPVPHDLVRELVALAVRAPSAGFSQGWDFVALLDPADRTAFWDATDAGTPPDSWRRGVAAAPALVVCLSDPGAYLDRYAEPDKGWTDRSTDHWPVPYWDTDTAMAAMVLLLGAEDAGLGALFFGVPVQRHDAVRTALGIPPGRRI
ncbi:MAG TPA: nitroreductase family protein, partial [Ornithinibacter sp.]|nr:nitroreductase family protein [Ornithinibacter sp.]